MRLLIPDPFSPQAYDILRVLTIKSEKIITLIPENPWYSPLFCPTALSFRVNKNYRLSLPPGVNALSLALRTGEVTTLARQYAEKVLRVCRKEGVSLLYPSSDDYVLLFSLFKDLFAKEKVEIPVGDFSLLCRLMDKLTSIRLARQVGLDVPLTLAASETGWKQFPALLKPRFGCAGEGQHLVLTPKELEEWRNNNKNPENFVLQEFIPGERIVYLRLYMDRSGRLYASSFAENQRPAMKLHQTRALLLHSIPIPKKMLTRAVTMLGDLKYSGYCHFQMKVDQRDNVEKVMEVNARISRGTWSEYNQAFDPVQVSRMLINGNIKAQEPVRRGDKVGTLYVWPLQDLTVYLFLIFQRLSNFFKGLIGSKVPKGDFPGMRSMVRHYRKTYFSKKPKMADNYTRHLWHDPLPAMANVMFFFINNLIKPKSN